MRIIKNILMIIINNVSYNKCVIKINLIEINVQSKVLMYIFLFFNNEYKK